MDFFKIQKARRFAREQHRTQLRRDSNEPYWYHVERVAVVVASLPGAGSDEIAIAYLHDVMEDCGVLLEELVADFGADVARYVLEVTNHYTKERYPNINRAGRKKLEHERLGRTSIWAKRIKAADRIDNLLDFNYESDAEFARVYAEESLDLKRELLKWGDDEVLLGMLNQLGALASELRRIS